MIMRVVVMAMGTTRMMRIRMMMAMMMAAQMNRFN
jgi:hypothetical protein